ncbi:hypothetical protein GPJ56_005971 [Histomonas meleagridis]|uniref:uncharacterized protein n=1 Tax=Histomonas meleagridis TaxID=135588 RepID=UPI00355A6204|nr:hypothetical protein GPJ56_005971 [Histomonas meleagridis]KAH0799377.1 hypothetical protein GO595_007778 [Histomonas meleagridis]
MKMNLVDPKLLFDKDGECPLFSHSLQFLSDENSVSVSAARYILLNFCLFKNPSTQALLTENKSFVFIGKLFENMNDDTLDFINDLLDVAPEELGQFILCKIKKKLQIAELTVFARAVSFLANGKARSIVIKAVSKRIHSFPITQPLTLALLLYSLQNHLILYDLAIKLGLISSDGEIIKFSNKSAPVPPASFFEEIVIVLNQKISSIESISLSLQIISLLQPQINPTVFVINDELIQSIREMPTESVIQSLLQPLQRQRHDLKYHLERASNNDKVTSVTKEYQAIQQLYEIQIYLCNKMKKSFPKFCLNDLQGAEREEYETSSEGKKVTLTPASITYGENQFNLSSIYVSYKNNKPNKRVRVFIVRKNGKLKTKTEEIIIEFLNSSVSNAFMKNVNRFHKGMIDIFLDSLVKRDTK